MNKNNIFTKKNMTVFIVAVLLAITAAVAFGFKLSKTSALPQQVTGVEDNSETLDLEANISKAILSVEEMSCSGCIATIKGSIAEIPGIMDIFVDVAGGRAEIYYDEKELKDVSRLEKAITASGYPARVKRIVTAEEIIREKDLADEKSQYYVASIGGYDISRADFDAEINAKRTQYEKRYGKDVFSSAKGLLLIDRIKVKVAQNLINEAMLLKEINRAGYKVDKEVLGAELQDHLTGTGKNEEEFRKALIEAGYDFEYYKKRFELKLLINRYLNEVILIKAQSQYEKQNLFNSWYQDVKKSAEVIYYDKDLERLVKNQGGSGSCCAVG
jgi:copper chaperone CopZ